MSDKCGENALECVCFDEKTREFAAAIIMRNLEETRLKICYEILEDSGMLEEFYEFLSRRKNQDIFNVLKEFGKQHPDKFYVPRETASYGHFRVIE